VSEGRVLRAYNSFYYVDCAGKTYTCKVKGRMKKERFSLCCGDEVAFDAEGEEGMITSVLPRRNFMQRPSVANLDFLILTMAVVEPAFSPLILDKLLVMAGSSHMPVVLVLNKIDLAPAETAQKLIATYRAAGYTVFPVSAKTGLGIDELRTFLKGKVSAFGGPSGVGKSSLMNALCPELQQQTGALSTKISRGRHTTRFATLLPFNGGYLADTPGFGNVFLEDLGPEELDLYFPEFKQFTAGCHYHPCSHIHEKVCGVKAAVAEGSLASSRYESYVTIRQELEEAKERTYRK
jgi:ribosome biogenesis GTPase